MASNTEPESSDSINLSTTNEDESTIGAKLAKKLEALITSSNNESDLYQNINQAATNILKGLNNPDPENNILILAIKLAESHEQTRLAHLKINEIEKRSIVFMRERDLALLENGRALATKTKLEDLCRELHRRNQQIRDENVQRQQDDEIKRRELAIKFQTTIEDIGSQLTAYSEKANSLHKQNIELSEELKSVFEKYELREQEIEKILKKKDTDLRLTEDSLEQSDAVNTQRTELIKQEREIIEAERLILYKKCEELSASESSLRSQLTIYAQGYQDFQDTVQQSSEMVISCQAEMEKMAKTIEELENERNDLLHRLEMAEQNHQIPK